MEDKIKEHVLFSLVERLENWLPDVKEELTPDTLTQLVEEYDDETFTETAEMYLAVKSRPFEELSYEQQQELLSMIAGTMNDDIENMKNIDYENIHNSAESLMYLSLAYAKLNELING